MNIFFKFFKILNSETDPHQISLALALSLIAGCTPVMSLHNVLILLLVLLLRVNLSAFILGFVVFSGIAYLLDPLFHRLGLLILTTGFLEGFWTVLYNSTIFRFEKFNNSIVMGSLVFSLVLFAPLFLILNMLIFKYRENVLAWVEKSRIMKAIKANRIYNLYKSVSGWGSTQ